MGKLLTIVEKMIRYARLGKSADGEAITDEAIESAMRMLHAAGGVGCFPDNVVPEVNGGWVFYWHKSARPGMADVEYHCWDDGGIRVVCCEPKQSGRKSQIWTPAKDLAGTMARIKAFVEGEK